MDSKTPIWQWIAVTAVSVIIGGTGALTYETRWDIRESKALAITLEKRVSVMEKANELQYQNIQDRQTEIKTALDRIVTAQKEAADALTKHEKGQAAAKKWQDYPTERGK